MTPSRRARRTLALAVLAGLTLTGCGAGIDAQTNQRRTFAEGANEVLPGGQILIRNFYLAPPEQEAAVWEQGSDVPAYAVFVNQGDEGDRLVRITSPVAERVTLWSGGDPEAGVAEHTEQFIEVFNPERAARPGGTDDRAVPGQEGTEEGSETEPGSSPGSSASRGQEGTEEGSETEAGPSPGSTASPGPSTDGAAAQLGGRQLEAFEIPVAEKLEVLPGAGYMLFEGLREDVYPGTTVEVTVEFERAGSHTFPAYVHVLGEPAERATPGTELHGPNEPGTDSTSDLEGGS